MNPKDNKIEKISFERSNKNYKPFLFLIMKKEILFSKTLKQ